MDKDKDKRQIPQPGCVIITYEKGNRYQRGNEEEVKVTEELGKQIVQSIVDQTMDVPREGIS